MAQFFYDFRDMTPGILPPSGMNRFFGAPAVNFYQQFSKDDDGLIDWLKNTDAGTGNYTNTVMYGPDANAADVECLVRLVAIHYAGGSFTNDGPSFFCRIAASNRYEISLPGAITTASTFARKIFGGSTPLLSGNFGGMSRATPIWIRFSVAGSNLRIKTWADGTAEPTTWGQTWSDSDLTGPGGFAFGIPGGSGTGFGAAAGRRYKIFQLSFGTDGDSAPSSRVRNVSGVLRKPDGTAAAGYLVRCYSRLTGELLSETLSSSIGAFVFTISNASPVYCLAVDQLGNSWNAPVRDLVTPSAP